MRIMLLSLLAAACFLAPVNGFRPLMPLKNRLPASSQSMRMMAADYALLFDCDGVIVETEELHRLAYNEAFKTFDLKLPNGQPVEWTVAYYDVLQNTVGGGKPKMMHYFNNEVKTWPTVRGAPAPADEAAQVALVDQLQDAKTDFYKVIVEKVATARPGVLALMDAAIADPNLKVPTCLHLRRLRAVGRAERAVHIRFLHQVGICSAATKAGFEKIVDAIVGPARLAKVT
jgi:hypothetical protein